MNQELYSLFLEEEAFVYFKKFFNDLKVDFNILSLPRHFIDKYKLEVDKIDNLIIKKDEKSYRHIFNKNNELFKKIQDIRIDKLLLSMYKKIEKHDGNISLLNSFRDGDYIEYTRSEIVTGRLSVKSGPKLMNLPRKYRNILKSRFENGEILMVDYKSLEPRVARYIAGEKASEDIYQEICDNMDFLVDRSVMKKAVISVLYGISEDNMNIGELSLDKVREIRMKVLEYFNINYILKLAMQQSASGYYMTYFGRPIHWNKEEVQLNQVLNGYIQGTAVDVALSGFLELVNNFDDKMIPIGLIHDAMLVDVAAESKNSFVKLVKNNYNYNNLGYFPLNIETISQRKS
jgi:hypothetical protein